jgi:hypothetical protein
MLHKLLWSLSWVFVEEFTLFGQLVHMQVLDYENTANTLLPLVAASYVLHAVGQKVWAEYMQYEKDRAKGRFDSLPHLHATSSGLKALCTEVTANGIEACRRTCGGHGYSVLSGLPTLFASYVQNVTWEGDNNVLLLQTARYLLKFAFSVASGKPTQLPEGVAYVQQVTRSGRASADRVTIGADGWVEKALTAKACLLISRAMHDLLKHPASCEYTISCVAPVLALFST